MFSKAFWQGLYLKLFKIDDTPQKISLGLALGVFLGIFPGTGPIAALVVATIFKLNRASALLGIILTNTWLSVISFVLSVKLGSAILGIKWFDVYDSWAFFLKDFHFLDLFKVSILKIVFPVLLGYFIIAVGAGIFTYLISLAILLKERK